MPVLLTCSGLQLGIKCAAVIGVNSSPPFAHGRRHRSCSHLARRVLPARGAREETGQQIWGLVGLNIPPRTVDEQVHGPNS